MGCEAIADGRNAANKQTRRQTVSGGSGPPTAALYVRVCGAATAAVLRQGMKYEETWGGFKIGDSTEASPVP